MHGTKPCFSFGKRTLGRSAPPWATQVVQNMVQIVIQTEVTQVLLLQNSVLLSQMSLLMPQNLVQVPQKSVQVLQKSILMPQNTDHVPHNSVIRPHNSVLMPHSSVLVPQNSVQTLILLPMPQNSALMHQNPNRMRLCIHTGIHACIHPGIQASRE